MKKYFLTLPLVCILCLLSRKAYADDAMFQMLQSNMQNLQETIQDLQKTVVSQNEVIEKLNTRIDVLESTEERPGIMGSVPSAQVTQMPQSAPKVAGLSQGFNPDIGVTGTVQAKSTESNADEEGNDTIALKELELNFAQVVDPYSRMDAIISFNDAIEEQNVGIEEAYYTRWGLPLGLTGQIGKFRSKIGKQNLIHLHALETTDYPMVIRDFFGEEGLASSGARLQTVIPNPLDIPFEVTGEILRGNNGTSFSGKSRRPIFNTHAKTYFDINKDANVELGWTTLFGDENPPVDDRTGTGTLMTPAEGQDRYGVKVFGGDATFNWFLPEGKKVKFQNEVYFQNRTERVHANENPWGFYSLLDFKFAPRFSTGVRFDYVRPLDFALEDTQTIGISPYITFWQSEFADFKLQYSHLEPADPAAESDNLIFIQADFLIGVHKHPVQ